MNKPIEKEGDADDFTIFLFSHKPNEPNSIKLELDEPEKNKHIGLHIFQQLLQIYVDGLKYLSVTVLGSLYLFGLLFCTPFNTG